MVTDEQIEKVAREIAKRLVGDDQERAWSLMDADVLEALTGLARWHIQQIEAAVRNEREAIMAMLGQSRRLAEKAAMQMPGAGVDWRSQARTIEACEDAIRQRGATTAENRDE